MKPYDLNESKSYIQAKYADYSFIKKDEKIKKSIGLPPLFLFFLVFGTSTSIGSLSTPISNWFQYLLLMKGDCPIQYWMNAFVDMLHHHHHPHSKYPNVT